MEKLFTAAAWDEVEMGHFLYYNVQLTQDLPGMKAGQRYAAASLQLNNGRLEIFKRPEDVEPYKRFQLDLLIREEVPA